MSRLAQTENPNVTQPLISIASDPGIFLTGVLALGSLAEWIAWRFQLGGFSLRRQPQASLSPKLALSPNGDSLPAYEVRADDTVAR